MTKNSKTTQMNKGELSTGFNLTSMGTTPQDEKNILLDALDGESMYIPRRDTYASAAYERSLRLRKDRQKRSTWQQLLIMINQLQKSIEADFQEISDILDEMRKVCEDTLEVIDRLNHQIDDMRLDHEFVTNIFDQSGSQGLDEEAQNRHVLALLDRYSERTGKVVTKEDDLSIILMAQIEYEQSAKLPELQHKIEKAGILYEEGMNAVNSQTKQLEQRRDAYNQMNSLTNSEEQLQKMEELGEQINQLKTENRDRLNTMKEGFKSLSNIDIEQAKKDTPNKADNDTRTKTIDLQSFGMSSSIGN